MSENWSSGSSSQHVAGEARSRSIDAGLRAHMNKVYGYMSGGLLITALAAYFGAELGIYQSLEQTPLIWAVVFAPLVVVLVFSVRLHKMSASSAQTTFWLYAGLVGFSLSCVLLYYTQVSVVRTFLITAASFGALSIYGYTTKRELSGMGSFLIMGVFGLILASIVNMFMASTALHYTISVLGVLIFAGLTAYDTQNIKRLYYAGDASEVANKKAIFGALQLYLDFINMFVFMLQFLGNRE